MTLSIRDVMTPNPEVLPAATTLEDAARCMRERNIGDVLVADESGLCGLVTDRDIVVRGSRVEGRRRPWATSAAATS